jgi:arylsulfatase A-like enzyme
VRRAAILCCLAPLAGCADEPPPRPGRGVLVIAIDALRADHLGAYGYDRATTPRLDRLAEEGILFDDAWAAAPELMASHVALLTGCDPTLARRPPLPDGTPLDEIAAWWVPKEVPRLAREFLLAGYRTAAFVDHPMLSPVYSLDAGFEHFTGYKVDVRGRELGFEAVGDKLLRWLQGVGDGEDWFAYVHVNDLDRMWEVPEHDPKWDTFFEPRAELGAVPPVSEPESVFFAVPRARFEHGGIRTVGQYEARYDGALRRLTNGIARLFASMKHQERWDDTTVVVLGTYPACSTSRRRCSSSRASPCPTRSTACRTRRACAASGRRRAPAPSRRAGCSSAGSRSTRNGCTSGAHPARAGRDRW